MRHQAFAIVLIELGCPVRSACLPANRSAPVRFAWKLIFPQYSQRISYIRIPRVRNAPSTIVSELVTVHGSSERAHAARSSPAVRRRGRTHYTPAAPRRPVVIPKDAETSDA